MENKVYEVKFNDFGLVHVVAISFGEAEEKFRKSRSGEDATIKSITEAMATSSVIL